MRVRQQDSLHPGQAGERNGHAQEVLVKAFPGGIISGGCGGTRGQVRQQFIHGRSLPVEAVHHVNNRHQAGGGLRSGDGWLQNGLADLLKGVRAGGNFDGAAASLVGHDHEHPLRDVFGVLSVQRARHGGGFEPSRTDGRPEGSSVS